MHISVKGGQSFHIHWLQKRYSLIAESRYTDFSLLDAYHWQAQDPLAMFGDSYSHRYI